MISFWQSIILGAVQGITEWLPVSSKGINILILLHTTQMPLAEALRFAIWLHIGTLFAALIYFRRDVFSVVRYLPNYFKRDSGTAHSSALTTFLIITTVISGALGGPLLIFGITRLTFPEGYAFGIIGIFLIATGLLQKFSIRSSGTKTATGIKDAVVLGVVQALSVFPGLSRSGLTVSALLFRGYEPGHAIKLSFLMSIPLVLFAEIGLNLFWGASFDWVSVSGIIVAFVFGILTINALLKLAKRIRFWKFCIILGLLSMATLVIELV